uniref:N-alpha-acetyltransferase 40 n=1 Tax=Taeniopygia guttata TaxID=59729 RepID=A0A674HEW0_TAEGU
MDFPAPKSPALEFSSQPLQSSLLPVILISHLSSCCDLPQILGVFFPQIPRAFSPKSPGFFPPNPWVCYSTSPGKNLWFPHPKPHFLTPNPHFLPPNPISHPPRPVSPVPSYEQSEWGWKEREKREELRDERAWYLLAREPGHGPVAFSHFRFDVECGDEVLYCYEVQLESRVRRRGLGKFLLQILQLVANSTQMKKVMLTVFKHNHGALQFFREALHDRAPRAGGAGAQTEVRGGRHLPQRVRLLRGRFLLRDPEPQHQIRGPPPRGGGPAPAAATEPPQKQPRPGLAGPPGRVTKTPLPPPLPAARLWGGKGDFCAGYFILFYFILFYFILFLFCFIFLSIFILFLSLFYFFSFIFFFFRPFCLYGTNN